MEGSRYSEEGADEGPECAGSLVEHLDLRRFGLVADMGVSGEEITPWNGLFVEDIVSWEMGKGESKQGDEEDIAAQD